MKQILGLDIGLEITSLALGEYEDYNSIKFLSASVLFTKGYKNGRIEDESLFYDSLNKLVKKTIGKKDIDLLNICVSGNSVNLRDDSITINVRKVVSSRDIHNAEMLYQKNYINDKEELIEILPVSYRLNDRVTVLNPKGESASTMTVNYRVYTINKGFSDKLKATFKQFNITNILIYPLISSYIKIFENIDNPVAILDMGAETMNLMIKKNNIWEADFTFPIACKAIDYDISQAFAITLRQAHGTKEKYGCAIREDIKNKKINIFDSNKKINNTDLFKVIQCRMEELFDGVIYQLQKSYFDGEIYFTGGGSRLINSDKLLYKMSGLKVNHIFLDKFDNVKRRLEFSHDNEMRIPEYLPSLGLLLCLNKEPEVKLSFFDKLNNFLKNR